MGCKYSCLPPQINPTRIPGAPTPLPSILVHIDSLDPTYVIAREIGGVCAFHTKKDNLNMSRSHLAFKYGGYVFLVLIAVSDRKLGIHSKR